MKKKIVKLIFDIILINASFAFIIVGIVFGIKAIQDSDITIAVLNFMFSGILVFTSIAGLTIFIPEDIDTIKRSKKDEQKK